MPVLARVTEKNQRQQATTGCCRACAILGFNRIGPKGKLEGRGDFLLCLISWSKTHLPTLLPASTTRPTFRLPRQSLKSVGDYQEA
jgi:hypothetical protein